MAKTLTDAEVGAALATLPGWSHQTDALVKEFEFGSFREAMAFMVRVAFEAEQLNHHPDWTNVYDRVTIRLSTHSVGGKVTALDIELAQKIETALATA